MTVDLEQQLSDTGKHLTLRASVRDVLNNGDRLRRRRRRRTAATVIGAVTVTVAAASVALPPANNPVLGPAVASLSGGTTNLSDQQLRDISEACLRTGLAEDVLPRGTMPLAAEVRDRKIIAYYQVGAIAFTCLGDERDNKMTATGGFLTRDNQPLAAGTHLGFLGFGYLDPGEVGGPVTGLWASAPVSGDVARVTARIDGGTYEGAVVDNVVLFWISDHVAAGTPEGAVFSAFDANGSLLQRVDSSAYAKQAAGVNDDADR